MNQFILRQNINLHQHLFKATNYCSPRLHVSTAASNNMLAELLRHLLRKPRNGPADVKRCRAVPIVTLHSKFSSSTVVTYDDFSTAVCVCVCVFIYIHAHSIDTERRGRVIPLLLLCIREVPGSNLGPEAGYPECVFSWFSSVPPGECWDSTLKLGHDRFLPSPFQFIHLSPFHSTLYNLNSWKSSSYRLKINEQIIQLVSNSAPTRTLASANAPFLFEFASRKLILGWVKIVKLCAKCTLNSCYTLFLR
jgi:hypothetical protein